MTRGQIHGRVRFLLFTALIVLLTVGVERARQGLPLWPGLAERPAETQVSTGGRFRVNAAALHVADGDTLHLEQPDGSRLTIRLLGIDAPELGRRDDPTALPQPFAVESRDFLASQIRQARVIEVAPAPTRDRFGRMLAHLYLDEQPYAVLAVASHLAEETVSRFGSNGFDAEASAVLEAARAAGPPPFASPRAYRDQPSASSSTTPIPP